MGAFCPLMENGGNGNHLPWTFDNETVNIYRKFVKAHHELVTYFLSAGSDAMAQGVSVMQPLASPQFFITPFDPSRWDYKLANEIYVFPITDNIT